MRYRPWGPVEWALSLSNPKQWRFIGVIGTEDRALCSWTFMRQLGVVASELFAEIHDVYSEKYTDHNRIALNARRDELVGNGGDIASIRSIHLMDELFRIAAFAR